MSTSRSQHLLGLIRALPPTPLRPAGSPQLSNALEGVANRITKARGEEGVEGMIGALERIQAGKAMAEFPLGNRTLRPRHDPMYYKRMMDGVHRAAQGQGRSWWKSFFQVRGEA
ncbi:hypothetical protein JCM24511_01448 [Saitozyma sp. JCM 24511]|nr:hypothetical protein JCM24511_01448 [Saitozyma sp. JCM 24511]